MVCYSRWRELPATPIPRGEGVLKLGALEADFKQAFPEARSRDFNNDPRFRVYTVKGPLPEDAQEAEVLFHDGKLFFTSLQWEDASFRRRFETWVKQSQAFLRRGPIESPLFNTPEGYRLVEWYLEDTGTEMILRELATPEGSRFWRDLRDRTNTAALTDFAPYRLNLPEEGGP